MGELSLKNIERPIRAFRVEWEAADWKRRRPLPPRRAGRRSACADSPLALPDKPSIAVLPFQNMSGDPEQEYFADGMVEDIITALSRYQVAVRHRPQLDLHLQGQIAVDIRQVGRELGVRYVLEGSVRKAGDRVRITGQLIDAANGAHIWADRFDGELEDIFELQDEVTSRVVGAIAPQLEQAEIERSRQKPTEDLAGVRLLPSRPGSHLYAEEGSNHEALDLVHKAI